MAGVFPVYVDRWLAGTVELSLEEEGAFVRWVASYVARDGLFPDDIKLFAEVWRCDIRVARRLRTQLFAKGKLYNEGGLVQNFLAKSVVAKVIAKSAKRADAAFKRWQNYRENNGNGHAKADANADASSMQMQMPSTEPLKEEPSYLGESQQPPPVDNQPPPQTLADLNHRMGWTPAGTRKPT